MLFVPPGLSRKLCGIFVQPAAMTSMLLSHSSRVICEPIDHLASLQEKNRTPVQQPNILNAPTPISVNGRIYRLKSS